MASKATQSDRRAKIFSPLKKCGDLQLKESGQDKLVTFGNLMGTINNDQIGLLVSVRHLKLKLEIEADEI